MTIAIFVLKLNISVSSISQIIFFFGRWFNYLDVLLQIPVGYYFVQIIMKCHSATVHHSNLTFIVFKLGEKAGSDTSNLSYCFNLLVSNVVE